MGLLKWLKREQDQSPSIKHSDATTPSPLGNKSKLTRNESYLRALVKFHKWRETRLAAGNSPISGENLLSAFYQNTCDVIESDNKNSKIANINDSQDLYEEIDVQGLNEKFSNVRYKPKTVKKNSISNKENDNKLNNDLNAIQEEDDPETEPEYAIPCNTDSSNDGSIQSNSIIFENYIENNLELLNDATPPPSPPMVYDREANKDQLIITDLDKSQSINDSNDVDTGHNISQNSNNNCKFLSEFLVCPLSSIKGNMYELGFSSNNGFIQHGEIDSIDISYFQIKNAPHNSKAMWNYFHNLRKLRHPNIVLLMGVSFSISSIVDALILEPLRCSLYESIHVMKNRLSIDLCKKYVLQLTNAVIFLHRHRIVHSNICSENIFICKTGDTAKLGGFELCSNLNIDTGSLTDTLEDSYSMQVLLPLKTTHRKYYTKHYYQAPELLTDIKDRVQPTQQSDIYGVCITLWEMLNNVVPYFQYSYNELLKIFSLNCTQLPIYEEFRCKRFQNILDKGLNVEANERFPNAIELKLSLQRIHFVASELNCSDQKLTNDLNFKNRYNQNTSNIFKHYELPYERTSTIKKRNKQKKSQRMREKSNIREFSVSPLKSSTETEATNLFPNKTKSEDFTKSHRELNLSEEILLQTHAKEKSRQKVNVNIFITSNDEKTSSAIINDTHTVKSTTIKEKLKIFETDESCKTNKNDSLKMISVKEKIHKFESFVTSSPLYNPSVSHSRKHSRSNTSGSPGLSLVPNDESNQSRANSQHIGTNLTPIRRHMKFLSINSVKRVFRYSSQSYIREK